VTTTSSQQIQPGRWLLVFLAALVAVLATLLSSATASVAIATGTGTHVRASDSVAEDIARPPEYIAAGQRLGRPVAGPRIVVATGVAAETASSGAESVFAGRNLARQLASEQQMAEAGTPLAGAGTDTKLRAAERLAADYGGAAGDWAKMGSSSYRGADGFQFETHWYENVLTGARFEFKTKFQWLP